MAVATVRRGFKCVLEGLSSALQCSLGVGVKVPLKPIQSSVKCHSVEGVVCRMCSSGVLSTCCGVECVVCKVGWRVYCVNVLVVWSLVKCVEVQWRLVGVRWGKATPPSCHAAVAALYVQFVQPSSQPTTL